MHLPIDLSPIATAAMIAFGKLFGVFAGIAIVMLLAQVGLNQLIKAFNGESPNSWEGWEDNVFNHYRNQFDMGNNVPNWVLDRIQHEDNEAFYTQYKTLVRKRRASIENAPEWMQDRYYREKEIIAEKKRKIRQELRRRQKQKQTIFDLFD